MSGTGATLDKEGEPGYVTSPGTTPGMQQTPSNPSTIVASTSVENIMFMMLRNFIYLTTLIVDPTMKAGTIFGLIRNHPSECNEYVSYASKMFQTWAGGMHVRVRFMANFANGGSFRVGFLPPKYTREEILALPLSTLTAFPNQDLDPKNTDWRKFELEDERNIMFHWMNDPIDNPAAFGGWMVFYVVGPLVTTLQAQGSVSLVVETAGNYQFAQPAALGGGPVPPIQQGPLTLSTALSGAVLSDNQNIAVTAICICATAIKSLLNGFYAGATLAHEMVAESMYASGVRQPEIEIACKFKQGLRTVARLRTVADVETGDPKRIFLKSADVDTHNMATNFQAGQNFTVYFEGLPGSRAYKNGFPTVTSTDPIRSYDIPVEEGDLTIIPPLDGQIVTETPRTSFDPAQFLTMGSGVMPTQRNDESIVLFGDLYSSSFGIQTLAMTMDLLHSTKPFDPTMSYVYNLRQQGVQAVLGQFRLCPNGMFTTKAVNSSTIIPISQTAGLYYLDYVTAIPLSQPLDAATHSALHRKYKIAELSAKSAQAPLEQVFALQFE